MQLVWMPRARRQRHEAIEYIAQDNPGAALQQLDRIEEQTDTLMDHPELGRPGRKKGTRELVISRTPFIVVYRVKPKAHRIELLVLLHGSQQWPTARALASLVDPRPNVEHTEVLQEAQAVITRVETKNGKPRDEP